MKLFVTGSIGSGKSTVCQLLLERLPGYVLFSVDDAVRALYSQHEQSSLKFCATLTQKFGTCVRAKISDIVFSDPAARLWLEELTHSFLLPAMKSALAQPQTIIEFPLFYEMPGWVAMADAVLAVGCSPEIQGQRVASRDAMSPEKLERVRAAQLPNSLKAALADVYLDTGVPLEYLPAAVDALLPQLHFHQLKARCTSFFGTADIWPRVEKAYSEPHRAYHNLEHLHAVFAQLEPHLASTPHAAAIELAVWFHDFVYTTKAGDYGFNEARSAKALVDTLREAAPGWLSGQNYSQVLVAASFILATKGHHLNDPYLHLDPSRLRAASLFLDADLSVLASGPEDLLAYDEAIAQEWSQDLHSPLPEFCAGRLQAIAGFEQRDKLFFSEEFAGREPVARENLALLSDKWSRLLDEADC